MLKLLERTQESTNKWIFRVKDQINGAANDSRITGATASIRGGSGFAAFAAAKFGLRALAQSMARELAPENIHVAHLIIDGAIDSEAIHRRLSAATGAMPDLAPDSLIQTSSIAEAYWALHNQSRDGWTHELDLRPYSERW